MSDKLICCWTREPKGKRSLESLLYSFLFLSLGFIFGDNCSWTCMTKWITMANNWDIFHAFFLKRCGSNRFSMQFHLESIWETESRTTKGISRERKQSKVKSLEPKNNDMTRNGVSLGLKKCLALNPFLLFHVWQEACTSLALDTVLSRKDRQTDSLSSSFLQSLEKLYFPCHPFRLSSSSSASSSISFWPRFRVNDEWKAEKDVRNLPEC